MSNEVSLEHALHLEDFESTNPDSIGFHFTRLYYGNEFCQNLIPSIGDLQKAINYTLERRLEFTLLTPYVTDHGIGRLLPLLRLLSERLPHSEVVFNDWGVLIVLCERFRELEPVMGRLLNKIKRDPRIAGLEQLIPEENRSVIRSCSLDIPHFQRFLDRQSIRRVEFDNTIQGINITLDKAGIRASLHLPYAYITTTRVCLANGNFAEYGDFTISSCRNGCRDHYFRLTNPAFENPMIRVGNTILMENDELPGNMKRVGIDRIVRSRVLS